MANETAVKDSEVKVVPEKFNFLGTIIEMLVVAPAANRIAKQNAKMHEMEKKAAEEESKKEEAPAEETKKEEKAEVAVVEQPKEEVKEEKKVNGMFTNDQLEENVDDVVSVLEDKRYSIKRIDLLITTMLYGAMRIDPEQLWSKCKTQEHLEFANSVGKFFFHFPLTTGVSSLDISEIISIQEFYDIVKAEVDWYNANTTDEGNPSMDEYLAKATDLLVDAKKRNAELNGIKDPDVEIPIQFLTSKMVLPTEDATPQVANVQLIQSLEKVFGEYIKYPHQFNKINDLAELLVQRSDFVTERYIIDIGHILGAGFSIMAHCIVNGVMDDIFVNQMHKDIIAKVLADGNYILTPEEYEIAKNDMFKDQSIYLTVDMTKGLEIFPPMSREDYDKLGDKLSFVVNGIPWNMNGIPMSRLRIRTFKSVDDFTLVSDFSCRNPLLDLVPNSTDVITQGLKVKVSKDSVVVSLENHTEKYDIPTKENVQK
jgi:hypothetical protein